MSAKNFLLLAAGLGDPAANMAWDEVLLTSMPRLRTPVLRLYGWTEPAATFGYFQKFAEVEQLTRLRPLIRRPTGGGIVPHDADWTYCAAFPPGHEWHGLKAEESYRRIHDWVRLAFAALGIESELAPCCRKSLPGQCFVGHEKYDLLWQGKKIAGAAQRRNQSGLLIQGSVQPPPVPVARADWECAMQSAAAKEFGVHWQTLSPDETLLAEVERLRAEKYSQAVFNQKR